MPATSMMWMRMPDQSWAGGAAAFVGMWLMTMVPMMLPTVVPVMWRHRAVAAASGARIPAALTVIAGASYLSTWTAAGVAAFPVGTFLMAIVSNHPALAPAMPRIVGLVVAIAGAIQLTPWKARRLACCGWQSCLAASPQGGVLDAWRDGARLGRRCIACCANLMVLPLVVGRMDLPTMAVAAAAIAAERGLPRGRQVARAIGAILLAAGSLLVARTL